ncbi:MAG: DUF1501 domain-containing protein [Chloroflexi bacterium]|nr:DUF1501 domain-containing protein [Chloroflexota bacterium]
MLTRRDFLRRSVVVVSAGLALPPVFTRAVHAATNNQGLDPLYRDRILVVVQMAGGNDGLNTLVPYGSGLYHDARPTIKITESDLLPLDGHVGFHPSLARLKELWDEGSLAVVQGVGYPIPNFSHFRSMEIWQTGNMEQNLTSGWLARLFEKVIDEEGHLLDGVSVGNALPLAMSGPKADVAVVQSLDTYKIQGDPGNARDTDARVDALLKLYASYPVKAPYAALLDNVSAAAHKSAAEIQRAAAEYKPAAEYPKSPLASGFKLLAQAITQNIGVRVCHIGMGGFDTHTFQPTTQARLLKDLSEALHAFYRDLEGHGKARDVLIMTWSEFGRRVQQNANQGTDHGTATPMLLLGGRVQRGFYGEAPSLSRLEDGNLRYTTDFRSVYASVLEDWLGAPADEILSARFERLPFVARATGARAPALPVG